MTVWQRPASAKRRIIIVGCPLLRRPHRRRRQVASTNRDKRQGGPPFLASGSRPREAETETTEPGFGFWKRWASEPNAPRADEATKEATKALSGARRDVRGLLAVVWLVSPAATKMLAARSFAVVVGSRSWSRLRYFILYYFYFYFYWPLLFCSPRRQFPSLYLLWMCRPVPAGLRSLPTAAGRASRRVANSSHFLCCISPLLLLSADDSMLTAPMSLHQERRATARPRSRIQLRSAVDRPGR